MDDSSIALDDLVDLKLLPAWANEPSSTDRYAHVDDEDQHRSGAHGRHHRQRKHRTPKTGGRTRQQAGEMGGNSGLGRRSRGGKMRDRGAPGKKTGEFLNRDRSIDRPVPVIAVHFFPRRAVFENVVVQIKQNPFAYSLFALARLFLAKPERYDVRLTATPESPLFQLGETGFISVDREFLERAGFRLAQNDFYKTEVTEKDPIKGNFTSVARDRFSGTVLGPTNHHDYQKRLRGLYERRFSRRMSFAEYQRQIEIVTDTQLVEQWKEDARKITSYSTLKEEPPVTFASALETERHFRDRYLPSLIQTAAEVTVNGNTSRQINDRALYRLIEDEWTRETRSPSRMMQELAIQFRQVGLQVFRHRRGMLFVSTIRPKALPEDAAISASVKSIIEAVAAHPRTNRKVLAEVVLANVSVDESDRAKLSLAADLHWLISEGHVIEFNDGALELPRVKVKQPTKQDAVEAAVPSADNSESGVQAAAGADQDSKANEQLVEVGAIDSIDPSSTDLNGRFRDPPLPEHIGGS